MSSFTKPETKSMKSSEIDSVMGTVLGQVFVNLPWSYVGRFIDLFLENRMNVELGFTALDLESCTTGEVFAAAVRIRERGGRISFHGPFFDLNPGSVDPGIRELTRSRFESLFRLVETALPEQVVLHTGFDPRHHPGRNDDWVQNSLSTFEALARRAEKLECTLVLENVFEQGPQLHRELLSRVNSPRLGFCLDVGHQQAFSRQPLDKWLQELWPYLKEVHLHDNDTSSDAHLPVGAGTVDFDKLFGFLTQKRISPQLTVEPHQVEHLYETLAGLASLASFSEFLGTCRKDAWSPA